MTVTIRRLEPGVAEVPPRETYGQTFRRLRKELGMSQREAAEFCDVSSNAISLWERDKRSFAHRDTAQLIRACISDLYTELRKRRRRAKA